MANKQAKMHCKLCNSKNPTLIIDYKKKSRNHKTFYFVTLEQVFENKIFHKYIQIILNFINLFISIATERKALTHSVLNYFLYKTLYIANSPKSAIKSRHFVSIA